MADPVIRYVHPGLNECTDPQATDWLHIVDVSATAGDEDRKVSADKFAIVASGVWSPMMTVSGSSLGTQTVSGLWVALRHLIYCRARIDLSAKNTNVGSLAIESLPFPAAETTQFLFEIAWAAANVALLAVTGIVDQTYRSSINVYGLTTAGQILENRLNNTHVKTNTVLIVSGWYLR